MGPEVEYATNAPLTELLRSVVRPGDYCAHGRLFLPMPTVNVADVGLLSLPVPDFQVRALTEVAERAPYGKGTETVVDRSVRDCWQIDAARLRIAGHAWDDTFATILDAVAKGLGFRSGGLEAQLYKLLVYPVGGFFAPHRDTEKVDGMVATLTISLPTAGAGGELVVRHGDREEVIDMNAAEPSELAFAAFYADCSHETRPVRDGHRLSLVYNLCVLPGDTETPRHAPDYSAEAEAVARHLADWRDEGTGKLVWLLEHDYTAAGLSFDTLKNADNAVAHVLAPATERADCALHAAIVHIEESGNAMYADGDYVTSWHWRETDIEAMEIGDIHSSRHWLDSWIGADGSRPPFDEIPLLPEELLPTGALDGAAPDERRVHEASGNEGVDLERSYRRAAMVIWPQSNTLDVIAGAGIHAAVDWAAGQIGVTPRERIEELSARLIGVWWHDLHDREEDATASRVRMLDLLRMIGDAGLALRFLREVALSPLQRWRKPGSVGGAGDGRRGRRRRVSARLRRRTLRRSAGADDGVVEAGGRVHQNPDAQRTGREHRASRCRTARCAERGTSVHRLAGVRTRDPDQRGLRPRPFRPGMALQRHGRRSGRRLAPIRSSAGRDSRPHGSGRAGRVAGRGRTGGNGGLRHAVAPCCGFPARAQCDSARSA